MMGALLTALRSAPLHALNPGLLERKRRLESIHFCHSEPVRGFPKAAAYHNRAMPTLRYRRSSGPDSPCGEAGFPLMSLKCSPGRHAGGSRSIVKNCWNYMAGRKADKKSVGREQFGSADRRESGRAEI
ncbi:hypothetical protein pRL110114 (plasmid) [Rhizobium johnstonii 3841]|uniref:Uncharacterized protein n=1 Tax=Rhizobium johnstonii (strain DSM 114642 / LMG 32736 / 3841) TaxID=216596 RepID=Q1M6S2_RHIJ3|nr:hypothetical protein pRL110114 [Rhizobium johnstonii 3841]